MIMVTLPVSADSGSNLSYVYETSSGISFSLSDFDIYLEDFENQTFDSSQEVVDFVYEVGDIRLNVRSDHQNIFDYKLTVLEIALLVTHFLYIPYVFLARSTTLSVTQSIYPDSCSDGQIGNAFQHAYWTMLLCKYTSSAFAIAFVTAHEEYDNNDDLNKNMDLHNNNKAYDYYLSNNISSNTYTEGQLANIVLSLMSDGELIYVIFNYRYLSRIVYYEATGLMIRNYSNGNFYSYTNSTEPFNVPPPLKVIVSKDSDGPIITPTSFTDKSINRRFYETDIFK